MTLKETAFNNIKDSIERLSKLNEKTWWKQATIQDQTIIAALFHRISTISDCLEEKKLPHINQVVKSFLDSLNGWVTTNVSEIKEINTTEIAKKFGDQSNLLENIKVEETVKQLTDKKPKPKNSESISALSRKILSIESKLDSVSKLNQEHFDFVKDNRLYEKSQFEAIVNPMSQIAITIENQTQIINDTIDKSNFSNNELIKTLSENMMNLITQYDDLKNELKSELSKKIHIRDSIQVLEIREDVEKFVASDFIKKVSLAIIPAVEALKDSSPDEVPKAILELESRCMSVGLIPIERLFS